MPEPCHCCGFTMERHSADCAVPRSQVKKCPGCDEPIDDSQTYCTDSCRADYWENRWHGLTGDLLPLNAAPQQIPNWMKDLAAEMWMWLESKQGKRPDFAGGAITEQIFRYFQSNHYKL